jgi:hypothetical protein
MLRCENHQHREERQADDDGQLALGLLDRLPLAAVDQAVPGGRLEIREELVDGGPGSAGPFPESFSFADPRVAAPRTDLPRRVRRPRAVRSRADAGI